MGGDFCKGDKVTTIQDMLSILNDFQSETCRLLSEVESLIKVWVLLQISDAT